MEDPGFGDEVFAMSEGAQARPLLPPEGALIEPEDGMAFVLDSGELNEETLHGGARGGARSRLSTV